MSDQHQQGHGIPAKRVRNMVRNAVNEKKGHEKAADCSPPFGQHMPDGDYSLLRAKILAKLDDEDIRDALAGLNARPL